jgi:hypothetical protein
LTQDEQKEATEHVDLHDEPGGLPPPLSINRDSERDDLRLKMCYSDVLKSREHHRQNDGRYLKRACVSRLLQKSKEYDILKISRLSIYLHDLRSFDTKLSTFILQKQKITKIKRVEQI